jgi:hypothetical protein
VTDNADLDVKALTTMKDVTVTLKLANEQDDPLPQRLLRGRGHDRHRRGQHRLPLRVWIAG